MFYLTLPICFWMIYMEIVFFFYMLFYVLS